MQEQTFNTNPTPSFWSNLINSATFRMFIIGFLVLILLIPLSFVQDLIRERERTKDSAVGEINQDWGSSIQFYGPILVVPYNDFSESTETDVKTGKVYTVKYKEVKYAYFFPDQLDFDATLKGEAKKRGIYETTVYQLKSDLKGIYSKPDITKLELTQEQMLWEKSHILIQTTNVKGITNQLKMKLGTTDLTFKVEYKDNQHDAVNHFELTSNYFNARDLFANTTLNYDMQYNSNGSENLQIIPIGKETTLKIKSNWKDPNHIGAFLPQTKKIEKTGFESDWKVLEMNRPFSQEFKALPVLGDYAFGVDLMIQADNYLQNERSAKYGFLVIGLTFLLFFLIQTLSKINIHPFQYLLIGLALIIFYTLLLSISEHSNFTIAYLVASIATVGLITLFSKSIMKNWKFPLFILMALTVLYTFIFVIIQLESYALLVGSIGLFSILAAIMYASRKIEWN